MPAAERGEGGPTALGGVRVHFAGGDFWVTSCAETRVACPASDVGGLSRGLVHVSCCVPSAGGRPRADTWA